MGVVYLATSHGPARFSKLLVVKELKPELVDDDGFLAMFEEEARLAARLNHANIVQTYEVGTDAGRHFMVMDYLEGLALSRVVRKAKDGFSLALHVRVLVATLQGLHYAHTLTDFDGTPLGIVHRDATPQNVFVTYDGQIKLLDFGIAKALDTTLETRTGVLKGKPAYMAPEQIAGEADARADVFAVGIMLWEALVGHRMWHQKADVEILAAVIKGTIPAVREHAPEGAPEELLRICEKATARSREDRYQSAEEMHEALESWLEDQKATTRELTRFMSTAFASERAKTRATIDQHLTLLQDGSARERIPTLRPPASDITPSGQRSGPLSRSQPSMTGTLGAQVPASLASVSLSPPASKTKYVVLGLGALVLVGLGVVLRGRGEPALQPNAALPISAETPPAPAPPGSHQISVRIVPVSATVLLAGRPVGNPMQFACMPGERHFLQASAPGYVTRERELSCDHDETLELALELAPRAPVVGFGGRRGRPPTASDPAPPPVPARPNEVNPNGGTKPVRPIETASPYSN